MLEELYEPLGTTLEQRKINEQEWNNPDNWHGYFLPCYSSELDNRPIVPGKSPFSKGNCNLAHPRGRMWHRLGWWSVIVIFALLGVILMISEFNPKTAKTVKVRDSKYNLMGIAVDDFKAKFSNKKWDFVIVALEPIELKMDEIPFFLRKYYSYERAVTGFPNHAFQYTISKNNKSLHLQVYCLSHKIRYIKIIYDQKNKDFALKIKHYLTDNFPEILTSM